MFIHSVCNSLHLLTPVSQDIPTPPPPLATTSFFSMSVSFLHFTMVHLCDILDFICKYAVLCGVAQSCPTVSDPMGFSSPGPSVRGDSPGKSTGVGCHSLLQGIFPTQGSNPVPLHCRQILYHLSQQGSPRILGWVAYPSSRGIFLTQELNRGLLHYRRILSQLSCQGSPYKSISGGICLSLSDLLT